MSDAEQLSSFQKICLAVTNGCGCACHTGIGFKSACDHCYDPSRATASNGTSGVVELKTVGHTAGLRKPKR